MKGLSNKVCKFPFTHGTLTRYLLIHHEEGAGSYPLPSFGYDRLPTWISVL